MEQVLPHIETLVQSDTYGKFVMEPLERGFGLTLGNSLRRALLSSIHGAAITSVKIDGVLHEFSTIPGVKEDTTELLLNLKELHVKVIREGKGRVEPKTIWIDVKGAGEVTGADVRTPSDVEVVNPEVHIATISDETAGLSMEMTVEVGKGYVLPDSQDRLKATIGVIPMGAAFTPVTKANFIVEPTRVGHRTDFDRLVFEIYTNGTIDPSEAISESARSIVRLMKLFVDFQGKPGEDYEDEALFGGEVELKAPDARIEELDFSVRTYNCLKKANVLTIGELVQITEQDLMNIRNFGRKSLNEVRDRLAQLGLSLKKGLDGESSIFASDDDHDDGFVSDDEEPVLTGEE